VNDLKIICIQSEYDDFLEKVEGITGMNERCSNCDTARKQIDDDNFEALGYVFTAEFEDLSKADQKSIVDCRNCLFHNIDFEIVDDED
jgi:hypothetical protein